MDVEVARPSHPVDGKERGRTDRRSQKPYRGLRLFHRCATKSTAAQTRAGGDERGINARIVRNGGSGGVAWSRSKSAHARTNTAGTGSSARDQGCPGDPRVS